MYEATTESTGSLVLIIKLPSKSVFAPTCMPLKTTFTNGIGSPELASVTFPCTMVSPKVAVGCWATAAALKKVPREKQINPTIQIRGTRLTVGGFVIKVRNKRKLPVQGFLLP